MSRLVLNVILLLLAMPYPALHAELLLYLSPDGSDGNAGTIEAPFATLQKARDTIRAMSDLAGSNRILVAGHLPSVGEVASYLLTKGANTSVQFQQGAVCRIDVDELPSHAGRLRWFLLPDQLKLMA